MRRVRKFVKIPTATNTVVENFEQLAACIRLDGVDIILLDTTFWGGLRQAWRAGIVCEKFQRGISVRSSGELGISASDHASSGRGFAQPDFRRRCPTITISATTFCGGKMKYVDGKIAVPAGPGLGVELDGDKLRQYAELSAKPAATLTIAIRSVRTGSQSAPETRFAQPRRPSQPKKRRR